MKKLLFSLAVFGLYQTASAQCTPDPDLIPDAFGVYPDTTTNFANGVVGEPYSQILHFKAPTEAGEINPQFTGATINTFTVTGVDGIPPGLAYACNISNCQYNGGSTGCAAITGTPTTAGTYEMTINITANITIPILGSQNVPQSFEGYRIIVSEDGGVSIEKNSISKLNVFPNPAQSSLTIANLKDFSQAYVAKILNVEGKLIQSLELSGLESVVFNTNNLTSGVYVVELIHANGVERTKFIKE